MTETSAFCEFDVSVIRGADNAYWLSADCEQGSVKAIPVRPPDWGGVLGQEPTPLDWLDKTVSYSRARRDEGLKLGQALSEVIFGQLATRRLFDQMRGVASASGRQIVLRLLGAPDDVANWPWELTTDPADPQRPLALARDVHLVRTPRVRTYPIRTDPIKPPLNLLVLMSNPLPPAEGTGEAQLDSFDLYEEKRHLMANLLPMVEQGRLHITVEDRPTVSGLHACISRQRRGFHVIHYLGHASPLGLWLEDARGRGTQMGSQQFGRIIQQNRDLKLVVFAGCRTAQAPSHPTPDSWEGGMSITHHVVRDAAPSVIGMQAVLPFRTERLLTRSFYQALTAGHSIAQSLQLARGAVWDGRDGRSQQLDWAIPALFSGGDALGPVLDPEALATPVGPRHRVSLRISPVQKELRFVARHTQLREAIDILSGRKPERLLCVRGSNVRPEDLSNFLDRAMEELGSETAQLFFSARDLGDKPRERIARFIKEILRQSGKGAGVFDTVDSDLEWAVMLESLAEIPMAIVVDHADLLAEDSPVVHAIRSIIHRRSRVRVAVVHSSYNNPFTKDLDEGLFHSPLLKQLSWSEVWDWIKGQLPGLAPYESERLRPLHAQLEDRLDLWEALAERITDSPGVYSEAMLGEIAAKLRQDAPTELGADKFYTAPAAAGSDSYIGDGRGSTLEESTLHKASNERSLDTRTHLTTPVRVAVAGPFTEGRDHSFLSAMSEFAGQYGLAGIVADDSNPNANIVAASLPGGSPFGKDGLASTEAIVGWLSDAAKAGVNILVCDFGASSESRPIADVLSSLMNNNILVIAAGGNAAKPCWPAWQAGVLGVGALNKAGTPTPYSVYFPDASKPDLYAPATLEGTSLTGWVEEGSREGTTFAALYSAAVAALVWATYRGLRAVEVRGILLSTSDPDSSGIRRLNVEAALDEVRAQILKDVLERGELELNRLISESGLSANLAVSAIDRLVRKGRLTRRISELGEFYDNPNRIAARYDAARNTAPGPRRTAKQEALFRDARALALRTDLTRVDTDALWTSRQLGARLIALASMYERPEMRDFDRILNVISESRSAFEQYYALYIAREMKPGLASADRDRLQKAVSAELAKPGWGGNDRRNLAKRIISDLQSNPAN